MLKTVATLMSVIDSTIMFKARAYNTFIVHASLMIVTYNCQNIFIAKATGFNLTLTHLYNLTKSYKSSSQARAWRLSIVGKL